MITAREFSKPYDLCQESPDSTEIPHIPIL